MMNICKIECKLNNIPVKHLNYQKPFDFFLKSKKMHLIVEFTYEYCNFVS